MSQREPDLLQLPSWDEFDQAEGELDYGEDGDVDAQGREEVVEASSSSPCLVEEPCSSSQIPQVAANDQLPRVEEHDNDRYIGVYVRLRQDLGPRLPQLGSSLSNHRDIGPALPRVRSIGATLPRVQPIGADQRRNMSIIGPHIPSLFNDSSAPTLPEDELRAHANSLPAPVIYISTVTHFFVIYLDNTVGPSSSFLPPPEPGEACNAGMQRVIGPAIPSDFTLPVDTGNEANVLMDEPDDEDVFGPVPPPPPSDFAPSSPERPSLNMHPDQLEMPVEDDDDVVGPMPPGQDDENVAEEYALRLAALERQKHAEQKTSKREEWMTQLPKKLTNYGLEARQFNKGTVSKTLDDSWTEIPEQKRKKIEANDMEPCSSGSLVLSGAQKRRDAEQERRANELNVGYIYLNYIIVLKNKWLILIFQQNRGEALLDVHQRKRRIEGSGLTNGAMSSVGDRRAFDRERDMEVRGLKGASASEIKERCGQLSSRFGHSNNEKFL
uniref:DUF3752 domain-containing protein n=1 Tax=Heterorhabditis bacteriophora TaxID=37862 RepID=A0A1I7X5P4_HETBA